MKTINKTETTASTSNFSKACHLPLEIIKKTRESILRRLTNGPRLSEIGYDNLRQIKDLEYKIFIASNYSLHSGKPEDRWFKNIYVIEKDKIELGDEILNEYDNTLLILRKKQEKQEILDINVNKLVQAGSLTENLVEFHPVGLHKDFNYESQNLGWDGEFWGFRHIMIIYNYFIDVFINYFNYYYTSITKDIPYEIEVLFYDGGPYDFWGLHCSDPREFSKFSKDDLDDLIEYKTTDFKIVFDLFYEYLTLTPDPKYAEFLQDVLEKRTVWDQYFTNILKDILEKRTFWYFGTKKHWLRRLEISQRNNPSEAYRLIPLINYIQIRVTDEKKVFMIKFDFENNI